ncbi:hypothetical protein BC830DRAFT_1139356 [Chytriomyces sp. MP71]|nr:hypothetical protein BC830DRAFT_1139356 [Chytriomyces sp. MP71]
MSSFKIAFRLFFERNLANVKVLKDWLARPYAFVRLMCASSLLLASSYAILFPGDPVDAQPITRS